MNRQAYFYRVPPQELHRRSQLQPEPAKTKALQTVIEMKVGTVHVCLECLALSLNLELDGASYKILKGTLLYF